MDLMPVVQSYLNQEFSRASKTRRHQPRRNRGAGGPPERLAVLLDPGPRSDEGRVALNIERQRQPPQRRPRTPQRRRTPSTSPSGASPRWPATFPARGVQCSRRPAPRRSPTRGDTRRGSSTAPTGRFGLGPGAGSAGLVGVAVVYKYSSLGLGSILADFAAGATAAGASAGFGAPPNQGGVRRVLEVLGSSPWLFVILWQARAGRSTARSS